jgi:hypothetical protein
VEQGRVALRPCSRPSGWVVAAGWLGGGYHVAIISDVDRIHIRDDSHMIAIPQPAVPLQQGVGEALPGRCWAS